MTLHAPNGASLAGCEAHNRAEVYVEVYVLVYVEVYVLGYGSRLVEFLRFPAESVTAQVPW
jgi:hypothetical protein